MTRPLEPELREVEQTIGKPIVLRAVRTPEPELRGRLVSRPGYVVLEYRDDTAGYFWDHDIIRELLARLRQGERDCVLRDEGLGPERRAPELLRLRRGE
jgi:hypothetical protein